MKNVIWNGPLSVCVCVCVHTHTRVYVCVCERARKYVAVITISENVFFFYPILIYFCNEIGRFLLFIQSAREYLNSADGKIYVVTENSFCNNNWKEFNIQVVNLSHRLPRPMSVLMLLVTYALNRICHLWTLEIYHFSHVAVGFFCPVSVQMYIRSSYVCTFRLRKSLYICVIGGSRIIEFLQSFTFLFTGKIHSPKHESASIRVYKLLVNIYYASSTACVCVLKFFYIDEHLQTYIMVIYIV